MRSSENRLVSFDSQFDVEVTTGPEGAEVWTRELPFDASAPGVLGRAAVIAPSVASQVVTLGSPPLGGYTQVRLVGATTGSPSGDGQLVDELIIPRLDPTGRTDYLSQCTESVV